MDTTSENSPQRLVDIFFYGLHMDSASLRNKGVVIRQPRLATIDHCKVRVGAKAMLLRQRGAVAHGMLYRLTHAEIDLLYSGQPDYRAEAFLVNDGEQLVCAISMVHVDLPLESAVDFAYVQQFRTVLDRLGFPVDHLP